MAKNDKKVTGTCVCGSKDDFYNTVGDPQCWQCDAPLKVAKVAK